VVRLDAEVVRLINEHGRRTGMSTSDAFWDLFAPVNEEAPAEPKRGGGHHDHPNDDQPS
jgi:hypothetical protein